MSKNRSKWISKRFILIRVLTQQILLFAKNHIGRSLIVLKQIFNWTPPWARTRNWKKKFRVKIFQSTGVPIRLLTTKKFSCQSVKNIMNKLWTSFKKFLMSHLSARSNLVNFCSTKNLTSNGSKPIRVLTRTKSSCSDDRLPLGYDIPDFELI